MPEPAFLAIALSPAVRRRATRISLVVGTALVVINQGDLLFTGHLSATVALKIALTFCVPYCVSTYSSVLAVRDQRQTADPMDKGDERSHT